VASETWLIGTEEKIRFLLGTLARERPPFVCVFCNLKSSAEEVSLRLDYNGVESDYILGALAQDRKLEILKRLKEEAGGVLVLTDEGAAGLPTSCFPLVINFDIPLEAELYVKRLEMLDRGFPGAKVVNLACDRYLYGLPAVEQHIGAKLESRQVTEDLLRAEDKSAALAFEKPSPDRGRRGPHAGRLVPIGGIQGRGEERPAGDGPRRSNDGRGSDARGGSDQDKRREGGQSRDSRRRRSGGRDEDRSPEIRQSIAELTGSASLSAARPDSGGKSQSKGTPERGPSGRGKSEGRRGGASGARNKEREPRGPSSRAASGRSPSQRDSSSKATHRGPAPQAQGSSGDNPYALPMEERMRLYREKYGQRLEPSQGGKGSQRSSKGGQGGQNAQGGGHDGKRQSQDGKARQAQRDGAQRQGSKQGQQGRRPQQNSRSTPQRPVAAKPGSGLASKPQKLGLIGKIRGLFGK